MHSRRCICGDSVVNSSSMNFQDIQSAMNQMIAEIKKPDPAIPMYLGDHNLGTPQYPYGVYKILELNQDLTKNASKRIEAIHAEGFKEIIRKNQRASVRISFLHGTSIETCWDLSEKAMDWFDSLNGLIECEEFGITPSLVSGTAQDETVLLDANQYEYKTSFDVLFQSRKYNEKQGQSTASAPTVEYQEET